MINYNIGDLVTRLNNSWIKYNRKSISGNLIIGTPSIKVPLNKESLQLLTEFQKLGVITAYSIEGNTLLINLAPITGREPRGHQINHKLNIISKPGKRVYTSYKEITPKLGNGYNTYILRTSEGIMSSQTALRRKIGGELLIKIISI